METAWMPRTRDAKNSAQIYHSDGLFDIGRPAGLHERIYQSLVHAIVSGRFIRGSKLPSEPELAVTFGVSRPVVRQALEKMRQEGLVESQRGSGNYVADLDELVRARRRPTATWAIQAKSMLDDLEFRLTVEPEAAFLAARRRGTADLERMRLAMSQFEDAHTAGQITHHFDFLFHEAIALATTNARFIEAARAIEFPKNAERLLLRHLAYFQPVPRGHEFIREHQRVLDLIEQRDPDAARKAMHVHLQASLKRLDEQLHDRPSSGGPN